MSNDYGLIEFKDEPKAEYYIKRASRKIAQLITSEQFDEDDITNLTQKQQDHIKEATAIYADYYWKDDFDFTEGSLSVSIGGQSFSETRAFNGEKVIPQVHELLQNVDLLEVDNGSTIILDIDDIDGGVYNPQPSNVFDADKLLAVKAEREK